MKIHPVDPFADLRAKLLHKEPFWFVLLKSVAPRLSSRVETACVTVTQAQLQMLFNPHFVEQLSEEQFLGLVLHELLHVALGHLGHRYRAENTLLWNLATDCSVNQLIPEKLLPPGAVTPALLRVRPRQSAEQYYEHLTAKKDLINPLLPDFHPMESDDPDLPGFLKRVEILPSSEGENPLYVNLYDDHKMWSDMVESQSSRQALQATEIICSAAQACRSGAKASVFGDLEGLSETLVLIKKGAAAVDWKKEVKRFMQVSRKPTLRATDWSRPNRRFRHKSLFIPGNRLLEGKQQYPHFYVALDTSASISGEEMSRFLAEVNWLSRLDPDIKLTILQCDTKIHLVETFRPAEQFQIRGRGGTSFVPVFKYVKEHQTSGIQHVIYLTDGIGKLPSADLACPTLWVISGSREEYNHFHAPFGFVTYIGSNSHW